MIPQVLTIRCLISSMCEQRPCYSGFGIYNIRSEYDFIIILGVAVAQVVEQVTY